MRDGFPEEVVSELRSTGGAGGDAAKGEGEGWMCKGPEAGRVQHSRGTESWPCAVLECEGRGELQPHRAGLCGLFKMKATGKVK